MKKGTWTLIAMMLLSGAIVIGCEQSSSDDGAAGEATTSAAADGMGDMLNKAAETGGDAMKATQDSAGNLGAAASSAIDSVVRPMQDQLAQYANQIESLKSKASIVNNADLNELVSDLSAKYEEIKTKIAAALNGDNAAIDALKADGSAMMDELKQLFDQAMAKLNEVSTGG